MMLFVLSNYKEYSNNLTSINSYMLPSYISYFRVVLLFFSH